MNISRTRERYLNDATFRAAVDSMRRMLDENMLDIWSLQEAAVEAANLHSMYSTQTMFVIRKERL